MVSVSVDNTPVRLDIADGETVTVPTGETWSIGTGGYNALSINGNSIMNGSGYDSVSDVVVTGGDDLKTGNGAISVWGWKL